MDAAVFLYRTLVPGDDLGEILAADTGDGALGHVQGGLFLGAELRADAQAAGDLLALHLHYQLHGALELVDVKAALEIEHRRRLRDAHLGAETRDKLGSRSTHADAAGAPDLVELRRFLVAHDVARKEPAEEDDFPAFVALRNVIQAVRGHVQRLAKEFCVLLGIAGVGLVDYYHHITPFKNRSDKLLSNSITEAGKIASVLRHFSQI